MKGSFLATQLFGRDQAYDKSSSMSVKHMKGQVKNTILDSRSFDSFFHSALPPLTQELSVLQDTVPLEKVKEEEAKLLQDLARLLLLEGEELQGATQSNLKHQAVEVDSKHRELQKGKELLIDLIEVAYPMEQVLDEKQGNAAHEKEENLSYVQDPNHLVNSIAARAGTEQHQLRNLLNISKPFVELNAYLESRILGGFSQAGDAGVGQEVDFSQLDFASVSPFGLEKSQIIADDRANEKEVFREVISNQLLELILTKVELILSSSTTPEELEHVVEELEHVVEEQDIALQIVKRLQEIEKVILHLEAMIVQNEQDRGVRRPADLREWGREEGLTQFRNSMLTKANPQHEQPNYQKLQSETAFPVTYMKEGDYAKQKLEHWIQMKEKLELLIAKQSNISSHMEASRTYKETTTVANKFIVLQKPAHHLQANFVQVDHIIGGKAVEGQLITKNSEEPTPPVRVSKLYEELKPLLRNHLQFIRHDEVQQIRVRLIPEHLGHLDIRITAQDGRVSATMLTSNYMAKEALELQIQQLRVAFAQQGINVDKIEITQQNSLFSNQHQQSSHEGATHQSRQQQTSQKESYEEVEEELLHDVDDEERSVINFIA